MDQLMDNHIRTLRQPSSQPDRECQKLTTNCQARSRKGPSATQRLAFAEHPAKGMSLQGYCVSTPAQRPERGRVAVSHGSPGVPA